MRQNPSKEKTHPLVVEFVRGELGYRRVKGGGKNQLIARAVGLKKYKLPLVVFDATAGLGKDSFILAALGCTVTLVERSPVIGALLQDGLNRALQDKIVAPIAGRMNLIIEDAQKVLARLSNDAYPDVIYIDPMFPLEEKSALNKIEMRMIRDLVGDDLDSPLLFSQALICAKKRVVVKRPRHAKTINALTPSFVVAGKANRYDVYLK